MCMVVVMLAMMAKVIEGMKINSNGRIVLAMVMLMLTLMTVMIDDYDDYGEYDDYDGYND